MRLDALKMIIDALILHMPGCVIDAVDDESALVTCDMYNGCVVMEFTCPHGAVRMRGPIWQSHPLHVDWLSPYLRYHEVILENPTNEDVDGMIRQAVDELAKYAAGAKP
jgi:hypothetical protein